MTETIALVVVLLCVIAVVVFMFRSLATSTSSGGGPFAGFGATNTLSGFGGGLLAAVAASTTLNSAGSGVGGAASVGAVIALTYALLTALRASTGVRIVSGTIGTAGFIALVVFLIAGAGCAVIPLWQRLLILGLILGCGALGAVGSVVFARPRIPSTLALFGALKIAVFLSAPLGISLIQLPVAGWVIAIVAAALLGALSAIAPQFVVGLATAVIGVASLSVGVVAGDTCSSGPDFADLAALVGFIAVWALSKPLLARILPR